MFDGIRKKLGFASATPPPLTPAPIEIVATTIDFDQERSAEELVNPPFKYDAKALRKDLQLPFGEFHVPFVGEENLKVKLKKKELSAGDMKQLTRNQVTTRFAELSRKLSGDGHLR